MKLLMKIFSISICLCLCVVLLSGCGFTQDDLDESWEDGHEYGYDAGYDAGFDDGIAFCEDLEDSEDSDYDNGYDDGYDDGYYDGYYDTVTYTCLFYGDVDRALQYAYEGSACGAFIDAYDLYISNIYDSKEARSQLFWAFVSLKSDDGLTIAERNLLISTFGESLFTRNGITLD